MKKKILNLIVGLAKIPFEMARHFATALAILLLAFYITFLAAYDSVKRLILEFRYTP